MFVGEYLHFLHCEEREREYVWICMMSPACLSAVRWSLNPCHEPSTQCLLRALTLKEESLSHPFQVILSPSLSLSLTYRDKCIRQSRGRMQTLEGLSCFRRFQHSNRAARFSPRLWADIENLPSPHSLLFVSLLFRRLSSGAQNGPLSLSSPLRNSMLLIFLRSADWISKLPICIWNWVERKISRKTGSKSSRTHLHNAHAGMFAPSRVYSVALFTMFPHGNAQWSVWMISWFRALCNGEYYSYSLAWIIRWEPSRGLLNVSKRKARHLTVRINVH